MRPDHAVKVVMAAVALVALWAAPAAGADVIEMEGSIGGQSLADSDPGDPAPIDPNNPSTLALELTNTGAEAVEVGHVRLIGKMLGITFVGYDVSTNFSIDPGETRSVEFPIELSDVDGQGHGFLRTEVVVYTPDRDQVGSIGFAIDVRGRPLSTMGVFAMLLLAITIGTALWNGYGITRRTVPVNAFLRGLRFAITGLGFGLMLAVGFSVLRIFPLPSTGWVPLVLVSTVAAIAVGRLLPRPELDLRGDRDEDLIDLRRQHDGVDLDAVRVRDAVIDG
jgi:hypothetical protein